MTKMIRFESKVALALVLALLSLCAMAQSDRSYIRSGNKSFRSKDYKAAEVAYRKALAANPENAQALYNLGCTFMQQNKASEAAKYLEKAASLETNKLRKSKIYHNMGVICQSGKMYDEAIKAYSESLRNNPKDNETRYNLALCKKLRKNKKNQNKPDRQKQDQDGKDQQKQQDSKKQDNKQNSKDQQQNQQPQMSKDNIDQLLNAAMQQEQETQQKLNRNRRQQQTRQLDKNW